jgi:uncharacterized repeat protein (TIGR03803 family)
MKGEHPLRFLVAFLPVSIGAGAFAACSSGSSFTGLSQPVNSVKKPTTGNYQIFGGSPDGSLPGAALLRLNGVLYGTTQLGGAYNNGTVFSLTP